MVQFANSMYSVYFLALSLYLSKLQLICQAQQALATFKSFVLSLLLRLMRARDSNLSSICYFVLFCIASVCICNHLLDGGALTEDNESSGFESFFYMLMYLLIFALDYLCLRIFKSFLPSLSQKGFH